MAKTKPQVTMGTKLCTGLLATLMVGISATPDVVLATFDGVDKTTTFQWVVSNDNVMGGSSTSTFVNSNSTGAFNGTCAIVKYLNAPGNAAVHTSASQELPSNLPGASQVLRTSTQERPRSFQELPRSFQELPR